MVGLRCFNQGIPKTMWWLAISTTSRIMSSWCDWTTSSIGRVSSVTPGKAEPSTAINSYPCSFDLVAILNRATVAVDMKFPLAPESIIAYSRLPLTVTGVRNTVVDDRIAFSLAALATRIYSFPETSLTGESNLTRSFPFDGVSSPCSSRRCRSYSVRCCCWAWPYRDRSKLMPSRILLLTRSPVGMIYPASAKVLPSGSFLTIKALKS